MSLYVTSSSMSTSPATAIIWPQGQQPHDKSSHYSFFYSSTKSRLILRWDRMTCCKFNSFSWIAVQCRSPCRLCCFYDVNGCQTRTQACRSPGFNKVHCAHYFYYSDIIARFSKQERNYLNQNSPAPYLETGQMWMFRCCLGNNNTEDRQYWRDDDKLRYVSKTPIFALAP